jgi:3-(3-hydroxy-phenyl)propionate hydroxylase
VLKLTWVVQKRAAPAILDSYDTERRPHARSIINLALLMGKLVMPQNRLTALGVHGAMTLMQRMPWARAFFEDLKIKPPARFKHGLFQQGKTRARLVRGGLLPQGLVRQGPGAHIIPSDDALGARLVLMGRLRSGATAQPEASCSMATRWRRHRTAASLRASQVRTSGGARKSRRAFVGRHVGPACAGRRACQLDRGRSP